MAKKLADPVRPWAWQVYKGDEWVGFFETKAAAEAWVADRPGYEVNTKRPHRKPRV